MQRCETERNSASVRVAYHVNWTIDLSTRTVATRSAL
jgi:hypothetical protein